MERISTISKSIKLNTLAQVDSFNHVPLAPPDPILGTAVAYRNDKNKDKMNLGIGAYRDDNEKPYVFNVIRKVEKEIANDATLDKEYLPIEGLASFVTAAQKLVFGADAKVLKEGRVASLQCLSGTGALRVGFDFLKKFLPNWVYVSDPTWGNHNTIISDSGLPQRTYSYYDAKTRGLNFEGMVKSLETAPAGSIFLLHACAHNPTGVDPTLDQWRKIASIIKERSLFPFLDSAYQGFATGCLERDAAVIRMFVDMGIQFVLAQSFAKNMGLYGERAGAFHIVCHSKDVADRALSQIKLVVRHMYSNPPLHGARIASKVMNDPKNFEEWKSELQMVSERIQKMRVALQDELTSLKVPGNWDHITNQIGMFSYTGLSVKQCEVLIDKWHIYLLKNGRISMAGITSKNVKYLANAIADAVNTAK